MLDLTGPDVLVEACDEPRRSWWPICAGVLFNHPIDTLATLPLIEQRMLRRKERADAYPGKGFKGNPGPVFSVRRSAE